MFSATLTTEWIVLGDRLEQYTSISDHRKILYKVAIWDNSFIASGCRLEQRYDQVPVDLQRWFFGHYKKILMRHRCRRRSISAYPFFGSASNTLIFSRACMARRLTAPDPSAWCSGRTPRRRLRPPCIFFKAPTPTPGRKYMWRAIVAINKSVKWF